MPGPRNMKKKKQVQAKKSRRSQEGPKPLEHTDDSQIPHHSMTYTHLLETLPPPAPLQVSVPPEQRLVIPERRYAHDVHETIYVHDSDDSSSSSSLELNKHPFLEEDAEPIPVLFTKTPFIHDPGTGPRVRDMREFLASSFAAPPTLDDPLCAEFAQGEMLEMLSAALPEETALILWYNRSRRAARVCPACQRLYRLGDALPDHLDYERESENIPTDPHTAPILLREQELSGLCSAVCFILAAFNYPGAIRTAWGRSEDEIDDETWDVLDGPGTAAARNDMGLGLLLKMTRCADLGLGELFFAEEHVEEDAEESEEEDYGEELEERDRLVLSAKEDTVDEETLRERMQACSLHS